MIKRGKSVAEVVDAEKQRLAPDAYRETLRRRLDGEVTSEHVRRGVVGRTAADEESAVDVQRALLGELAGLRHEVRELRAEVHELRAELVAARSTP